MYYEKDQLLHESVQIKFDDSVVSSNKISTSDPRNKESKYKGLVSETIHFTEGDDKDIPRLIALNYNKKIMVILMGQEHHHEYVMSNKQKKSIKDSYNLTEMLKRKSLST